MMTSKSLIARLMVMALIVPVATGFYDHEIVIHPLPIVAIGQQNEKWCFAACAEMAIGYLEPRKTEDGNLQCYLAELSLVPPSDVACCVPERPEMCTTDGDAKTAFRLFEYRFKGGDAATARVLSFPELTNQMTRLPESALIGTPVIARWYWIVEAVDNKGERRDSVDGSHNVIVRGTILDGDRQFVLVNDPLPTMAGSSSPGRGGEVFGEGGDLWAYRYETFHRTKTRRRVPPKYEQPHPTDYFDIDLPK